MWNNITCLRNCRYRTAATQYTLETWFVSGIIVNILYKGDNQYNNNNNNNNNNNTRKIKDSVAEKTKERWHGKRMHGQLPRNLDEKLVDIEQSYR